MRGIGPSLTAFGVPNALADPTLELRNNNGTLLVSDDNWQDNPAQAAIISAAGLAPSNNLESAIAATLAPGQYTALLAGLNNGTREWAGGSLRPRERGAGADADPGDTIADSHSDSDVHARRHVTGTNTDRNATQPRSPSLRDRASRTSME